MLSDTSGAAARLDATDSMGVPTRYSVEIIQDRTQLMAAIPEWEALASRALEPNVFYEHWMMLPALRHFHAGQPLEIYVVYGHSQLGRQMLALVPFTPDVRLSGRLAFRRYLLRYHYCGLCTPLVDRTYAADALRIVIQALSERGGRYDFTFMHTGGPLAAALGPVIETDASAGRWKHQCERALLKPQQLSAKAYLAQNFSRKRLREWQRLERRLQEHGTLHYDTLQAGCPVERWIDEFLALESAGWKGREGTAFASREPGDRFLRDICRAAHERGHLEAFALRLNGRPIAMLLTLTASAGVFAFRTAYDETYSRYSPGTLLCLWHTLQLFARPEISWADSCADPDSALDNRLWPERLPLGELRVTPGFASRFRRSSNWLTPTPTPRALRW